MPNKMYNYNEEDVYKILNKDVKRKTVIYARVSTGRQKNDLQNRIEQMKHGASWMETVSEHVKEKQPEFRSTSL